MTDVLTGTVLLEIEPRYSTIYSPKRYEWDPQPDITSYELARCLPVLLTAANHALCDIEPLIPTDCRRHFRELVG